MRQFVHLGPAVHFTGWRDGMVGHDVLINGKHVADLSLTIRDDDGERHAVVEWLGKKDRPFDHRGELAGANTFGPKFVRQVLRAIRDTHKITGSITGKRISGFREKRRGEAVNEYGEPLPLPPVVDAPFDKKAAKLARLRLRPAETRTSITGDPIHSHTIEDDSGVVHGTIEIVPRNDGRHLHIHDFAHKSAGPSRRDGWNALGVSGVRDVMSHLAKHYPDAEFVSGFRASGTAARGGNVAEERHVVDMTRFRDKAKQRAVKLSRVGRWLRGLVDSLRDEIHESLGRSGLTPSEAAAHRAKIVAKVKAEDAQVRAKHEAGAKWLASVNDAVKRYADQHHERFAQAFNIADKAAAHKKLSGLLNHAIDTGLRGKVRIGGKRQASGLDAGGERAEFRVNIKGGPKKLAKRKNPNLAQNRPRALHDLLVALIDHRGERDTGLHGAAADAFEEAVAHKERNDAPHPIAHMLRHGVKPDAFSSFAHGGAGYDLATFSQYIGDGPGAPYEPVLAGKDSLARAFYAKSRQYGWNPTGLIPMPMYRRAPERDGRSARDVLVPGAFYSADVPRPDKKNVPNLTTVLSSRAKRHERLSLALPFEDANALHEFIDTLPPSVRPHWRKWAADPQHQWHDTREKPVKLMGGFAGGTNTDVPNLVKTPVVKHARQRFAGEGAAVAAAGSTNHEARLKVAKQILAESGLTPAEVRAAVLHAGGGTRPALAAVISKSAHPDHVKYTAAWLGLATQQPGVAVATVDPAGRDTLHVLHVGGGHEGMTQALKRAGVDKFTVESGKGGGHRIWILNPDGKYPVKQLAQVNNARHSSVRVSVTRLGAGSSSNAAGGAAGGTAGDARTRAAYREAIDAFERAGA